MIKVSLSSFSTSLPKRYIYKFETNPLEHPFSHPAFGGRETRAFFLSNPCAFVYARGRLFQPRRNTQFHFYGVKG